MRSRARRTCQPTISPPRDDSQAFYRDRMYGMVFMIRRSFIHSFETGLHHGRRRRRHHRRHRRLSDRTELPCSPSLIHKPATTTTSPSSAQDGQPMRLGGVLRRSRGMQRNSRNDGSGSKDAKSRSITGFVICKKPHKLSRVCPTLFLFRFLV